MRWSSPRPGDRRSVRRFAWLPTTMHGGVVVWLEMYSALQRFAIWSEGEYWEDVERWSD